MLERHSDLDRLVGPDTRLRVNWLATSVFVLSIVTAVGLFALWPRSKPDIDREAVGLSSGVVTSTVIKTVDGTCSFAADLDCHLVTFEINEGPSEGSITTQEWDL